MVPQRTLSSLIEGGEQAVRLDIASNQLYFRVEWEDQEDSGGWLPVTLADGYPVKGKRSASLNKQIRYWDKVITCAVNRNKSASGFALSWGWAILAGGSDEATSRLGGFISTISHW